MPSIQMLQAWCLIGFLTGPLQVWCLQMIPLDMAMNSVDDQYIGCSPRKELRLQQPGYLPVPPKYRAIWEKARRYWAKLGQTFSYSKPIYDTAVVAYTIESNLFRDFNIAVRVAGTSQHRYNHFAFKDFHFLLTKAVQSRKIQGKCYEVFRGISDIQFNVHIKQFVRFGQFASASEKIRPAQMFGKNTLFSIRTCHGMPIHDLSYYPQESEVLIPPYERFMVTNHKKGPKGVTIRLESWDVYSRINCEVLTGP